MGDESTREGGSWNGGGTRSDASSHFPTDVQLRSSSLDGVSGRLGAVPSAQSHRDPIYYHCHSGWGCGDSCPLHGFLRRVRSRDPCPHPGLQIKCDFTVRRGGERVVPATVTSAPSCPRRVSVPEFPRAGLSPYPARSPPPCTVTATLAENMGALSTGTRMVPEHW